MPETPDPTIEWLEKARALIPLIEQHREKGEEERRLQDPVFEAFRQAGFFRMWMPSAYGGYETPIESVLTVGEEVSRHDPSAAWNLIIGVIGSLLLAYLPETTAQTILASDSDPYIAGAGSPAGAKAVSADGGYVVSGTWALASGCHHADWLFGGAFIYDDDKLRTNAEGRPEVSIFLFPRTQAEILDTWNAIGLRGTGSHHIKAEAVFVPDDLRLSIMTSPPVQSGPLYRGPILDGLGTLPVVSLGIARAAIDSFVELAASKTPTQGRTKLADLQTTHERVGRAEMLLGAARAFLFEVAREIDQAWQSGRQLPRELAIKRRLANVNAVEAVMTIVDTLYIAAGTSTFYGECRLPQCVRDIRTVSQHFVASPSNVEMAGRYQLTGRFEPRL